MESRDSDGNIIQKTILNWQYLSNGLAFLADKKEWDFEKGSIYRYVREENSYDNVAISPLKQFSGVRPRINCSKR